MGTVLPQGTVLWKHNSVSLPPGFTTRCSTFLPLCREEGVYRSGGSREVAVILFTLTLVDVKLEEGMNWGKRFVKKCTDNHSQERQSSVFFSPLSEGEVSVTGDNQKQGADGLHILFTCQMCRNVPRSRTMCVYTPSLTPDSRQYPTWWLIQRAI